MTEFKGDKRSKAYKEWKKNHAEASKGFRRFGGEVYRSNRDKEVSQICCRR